MVGVVGVAILWSLWGLGRRLDRVGGGKAVGHLMRTLTFWIVGLMNTVLAEPGRGRTWEWWVAVMLRLAFADSVALYRKEQRARRPEAVLAAPDPAAPGPTATDEE